MAGPPQAGEGWQTWRWTAGRVPSLEDLGFLLIPGPAHSGIVFLGRAEHLEQKSCLSLPARAAVLKVGTAQL